MSEKDKDSKSADSKSAADSSDDDGGAPKGTPRRYQKKKDRRQKPTSSFKGKTTELKDHVFVYTELHTKKWIRSREEFIKYAGRKYTANERLSLKNGKITLVTVEEPAKPTGTEKTVDGEVVKRYDQMDMEEYRLDMKEYRSAHRTVRNNLTTLYEKLLGQCDQTMENKIAAHKGFEKAEAKADVIGLLAILDDICQNGDEAEYVPLQVVNALKRLLNFRQTEDMSLATYYQQFDVVTKVAEKSGATLIFAKIKDSIDPKWAEITDEDKKLEISQKARDYFLAILFMMNSYDPKFGAYKQQCRNSFYLGDDKFPKTVEDAHTQMQQDDTQFEGSNRNFMFLNSQSKPNCFIGASHHTL